jgi:class 3 adenylate cyclase
MFYFKWIIFIFTFILFHIPLKVCEAQRYKSSETVPGLAQIIINGDSVISFRENKADSILNPVNLILDNRSNNLKFRMAPPGDFEYQFYLRGFDNKWTSWDKSSTKEYTNLPAGDFVLTVRYRASCIGEREIIPLTFRVREIWYLSAPAKFIYCILFLLLILAIYASLRLRFSRKLARLEKIINKKNQDLMAEKEKTEKLLANLLPKNAADEIMAKGKATKVKYNFVTVLFSDIQGFTRIAEETNPEVLIDELDKFFFYFDSVVGKYGIEKIKTIGDAYMCAGGIPEKNRTNPVEVILAALDMRAYMLNLKMTSELEGMKYWDIRIGIHTGTVVAGVVGQKKLSFDIWGDTVNTASRMESSGEGGKINISGTTYEFVREFFDCEYRGKMPVKYKGELEMYFVKGIKADLCDEQGAPNRKFNVRLQMIKLQDVEEIVTKMFDDEAPPNLYFHNSSLVKNICNQVDLISNAEKLSEEEYVNLKLAAVFLLTGFITDYENPMEQAINLVQKVLPGYGFNHENIEATTGLIRNSFTDNYTTVSDDILHDARYDYLGRVDFMKLTDKLQREMSEYGMQENKSKWIGDQKNFLLDHQFRTNTARLLRSVSLEEQLANIQMSSE